MSDSEKRPSYCPGCGAKAAEDDRFCGSCGRQLTAPADRSAAAADDPPSGGSATPPATPGASAATGPSAGSRRGLKVGASVLALVAALAVVAVLLLSGGSDDTETEAQAARSADQTAFKAEMRRRDTFFTYERRYRAAMGDTYAKLREWRSDERSYREENKRIEEEFADEFDACYSSDYIPCPSPSYPDAPKVPSFTKESKRLRTVADDFQQLVATLTATDARPSVTLLHNQMTAATTALEEEARHNADVLSEAVIEADGESPGSIDKGKIETLRAGTALPSIKQMNRIALQLVRDFGLALGDFDLPGGRDLDTEDHSDEI